MSFYQFSTKTDLISASLISSKYEQATDGLELKLEWVGYSIFKSFVTRSEAEDSAVARRGERDKVTDGLELE